MATKSLPGNRQAIEFDSAALEIRDETGHMFYIWCDPRGGVNIQGDGESLVYRPRNGRSVRIVAETPDRDN
jgi:hypothetical protein